MGFGGTLTTFYSTVTIRGLVTFVRNGVISGFRGALLCYAGMLTVNGDVTFISNSGRAFGGGLFHQDSAAYFSVNVSFIGNDAMIGGGICTSHSTIFGLDISFVNNTAAVSGAGISSVSESHVRLISAHFENNSAKAGASIVVSNNSIGTIANITIIHNQASIIAAGVNVDSSKISFFRDKLFYRQSSKVVW